MRRIGFEFMINYHSAAELLLYGTGWQVATPTPDDVLYEVMAGDDRRPAVPGYDPDISAELYTTNGETTEHAQEAYGTLAFTPEMSTCETASAADPRDAFEPEDCGSVFEFPDSEPLIQAEFEKNMPFALAVARSAQDPSNPVSVVGRTAPDFVLDPFTVSYGSPQPVAVTARRDLQDLRLHYRIAGGREQTAPVEEWAGGERYGDDKDVYYAEFRGAVTGARPGQRVEVWFTGSRPGTGTVSSSRFAYTLARTGGQVLVLANEDYEGFENSGPDRATAPRYAQQYLTALDEAGFSTALWDVSKQGVPHDLGVLGHFRSVVWYLGDNRLTQDAEDVVTETFFGNFQDASVAERQQYLTLAVRDYLNAGGSLALTGETTGYSGVLGTALGGIYYGLDGAPERQCRVTADPFSDCLLLADDFIQYYLGAYNRAPRSDPATLQGVGAPITGTSTPLAATASNPLDEVGTFVPTSAVLPVSEFPQFTSQVAGVYTGGAPGNLETFEGDWFAAARHADNSYMRLARTIDLTGVGAAPDPDAGVRAVLRRRGGLRQRPRRGRPGRHPELDDAADRRAHRPGPADRVRGRVPARPAPVPRALPHPGQPVHDAGLDRPVEPDHRYVGRVAARSGSTCPASPARRSRWRSATSPTRSPAGPGCSWMDPRGHRRHGDRAGGLRDGARAVVDAGRTRGQPRELRRLRALAVQVGAVITTDDTVLLGFGIEQVPGAAARRSLLGAIVGSLLAGP